MSKQTLKALGVLCLATIVFYWKILLVGDFSLLTEQEAVNQAYSWFHFWIVNIRQGVIPIWDPYTWAGHSFIGEMQTAAFYPLHLLLALFPLNRHGLFSPQLYNWWFAFSHFLGVCFMFALARELGRGRLAAMIAGVAFGFAGFVGRMGWPHMFESAIWLPLIFLFLLRAHRAQTNLEVLRNAAVSGLFLGMATLAGATHVVIMQGIIIVSWAAYAGCAGERPAGTAAWRSWLRPGMAAGVAIVAGAAIGAVQLLPSFEYSSHAIRFLGGGAPAMAASARIPYTYLGNHLYPQGLMSLVFSMPIAPSGAGETGSPYVGVLPLLAAIIGIWKCWENRWVRYLTGLAVASSIYALGPFSPLHGWLYALVPKLWIAREPSRFMYLADFALPLLAAFGIDTPLAQPIERAAWRSLERILTAIVIVCLVLLAIPAVFQQPAINAWTALSLLLITASYLLVRRLLQRPAGRGVCALTLALVLFDLGAFDWLAVNKIEREKQGPILLDTAINSRQAAQFVKTLPGPFRVELAAEPRPNLGDLYQVPILQGSGATLATNYALFAVNPDLLNARYTLKPASVSDPGEIYHDRIWKIYEKPNAFPHAWIVHETVVEPAPDRLRARLRTPTVDLHRVALLGEPLPARLEPLDQNALEDAAFHADGLRRLSVKVHAESQGLLVLSEMFAPGWKAAVNGRATPIHEVDGLLRAVVVPRGDSRVEMHYAPASITAGAVLSGTAFLGVIALLAVPTWRKRSPHRG